MQIPKDYPMVITAAVAINLHCYLQSFKVSAFRKEIFNKQFLNQHWGLVHKNQMGEQIMPQGYPDTGNGLYSQKLSYGDWYKFNVLQRNHHNYLEQIPIHTISLLAAGLFRPKQVSIVGLLIILSRIMYTNGYSRKHGAYNSLRMAGASLGVLCLLTNIGIFGYYAFNFFKNR